MTFNREIRIRFQHCDPAGIVFYPRYFEMFNQVVEDWFQDALGVTFQNLHLEQELGTPVVNIECDFLKASRIGDLLNFGLQVTELGRSSIHLKITASSGNEVRLDAKLTLVCVTLGENLRSTDIPGDIRKKMEEFKEPCK